MSNSYFQFKQFLVRHDRCAMKVGTDGVLLGAWTQVPGKGQILDVGTGTGLIALMLAQRSPNTEIIGVDIDADAVEQAVENTGASPWADRIQIMQMDFKYPTQMQGRKFDLIVSNPPFFKEKVFSNDSKRNMARSAELLPLETLFANAEPLLAEDGLLSLVLPYAVAEEAIGQAALKGLFLLRRCDVQTKEEAAPKRALMTWGKTIQPSLRETLVIYDAQHHYTADFNNLTSNFYLGVF